MKVIVILVFCISITGKYCYASVDDELEGWRERASKTKAGMSLVEAERFFPVYTSPDRDGSPAYFPSTFCWGAHQTRLRWVAAEIAVWIDYYTSPPGNPLTGPVTVERRNPPKYPDGLSRPALSDAPFTLSNTISKDAVSISTMGQ